MMIVQEHIHKHTYKLQMIQHNIKIIPKMRNPLLMLQLIPNLELHQFMIGQMVNSSSMLKIQLMEQHGIHFGVNIPLHGQMMM